VSCVEGLVLFPAAKERWKLVKIWHKVYQFLYAQCTSPSTVVYWQVPLEEWDQQAVLASEASLAQRDWSVPLETRVHLDRQDQEVSLEVRDCLVRRERLVLLDRLGTAAVRVNSASQVIHTSSRTIETTRHCSGSLRCRSSVRVICHHWVKLMISLPQTRR